MAGPLRILTFLVIAGLLIAGKIVAFTLPARVAPPSQGSTPASLPAAFGAPVTGNIGSSITCNDDTRTGGIWWFAETKRVKIRRNERESPGTAWASQLQELSAPFFVIDARFCHGSDLYVAGIEATGEAVIERWTFAFAPKTTSSGAYVPIDQRRQPTVRRTTLYRGTPLGAIRSIEPDSKGRFLLALSDSPRVLYRIGIDPPHAVTTLHTTATLPELDSILTVRHAEHAAEGPTFLLKKRKRWHHSTDGPPDFESFVIFLNEPDGDGTFEAPVKLDTAVWAAYADRANWKLWSSVGP